MDEGDPATLSAAIDHVFQVDSSGVLRFGPDKQSDVYDRLKAEIQQRQVTVTPQLAPRKFSFIPWIKIAALWLVAASIGLFMYYTMQPDFSAPATVAEVKNDIRLPEYNEATLTLADGRTIVLNDSSAGILVRELGVEIRKTDDGSIFYEATQADIAEGEPKYNTFATPRGSTYRLMLPDGTKVWLNTASSIRYPVVFTGNERNVSLHGEAYFEVAPDVLKPFNVEANGSVIQVLGTHFNVSAYTDEQQTRTTLVEGAVTVSNHGNTVTLKPNEQAVVDALTGAIHQSTVDVRSAVAWKDGYFRFDDDPLDEIIYKVSRWYDIEAVEYQGEFKERFSGTFQRSKSVSQLFNNLEKLAPIRFEIKERRVVIMK